MRLTLTAGRAFTRPHNEHGVTIIADDVPQTEVFDAVQSQALQSFVLYVGPDRLQREIDKARAVEGYAQAQADHNTICDVSA